MHAHKNIFHVKPGGSLQGRLRVPGDKSISHRALMLGALAEGTTHIGGFLPGEDCLATLNALRNLGVEIHGPEEDEVVVRGKGLHGLTAPKLPLDMGNSGTAMRLMAGILAGQSFNSELSGDESLCRRPMGRIVTPLRQMGAVINTMPGELPPLTIIGQHSLHGIQYQLPVASAQVKSCLLLAGLYASDETSVTEPVPTRDHTERMLETFGYKINRRGAKISIKSGGHLVGTQLVVPADISSAAFFMVGAAIAPGSDILLQQVGVNPYRIGIINILRLMGADLELSNEQMIGNEPVADIRIRASRLHGIDIPMDQVPLAIDEFPALFVAAACAKGVTTLHHASELRVKESDRIQVMAEALQTLGIMAEPLPDGIRIEGGQLQGGTIDSVGDHRIAMAMAIAGLRAEGDIFIHNCRQVATSFPNFVGIAGQMGLAITDH